MVGDGIDFLTSPIDLSGSTGSIASGGKNTRSGCGPTPSGSIAPDFTPPNTSLMLGAGPWRSATGSDRGTLGGGPPGSGVDTGTMSANGSGVFDHGSPRAASGSSLGVPVMRSGPAPAGGIWDPLREATLA